MVNQRVRTVRPVPPARPESRGDRGGLRRDGLHHRRAPSGAVSSWSPDSPISGGPATWRW